MSDQCPVSRRSGRILLFLLLLAVVSRCGAVLLLRGNLTDDRDVYLSLARGLRESRGFSVPGTEHPTAFRPPLYPMLLAVATSVSAPAGVAVLNILLGAGTVAVTFRLGLRLRLPLGFAAIAGGIVAVDPLLLMYTTFPMTETLCAFLAGALLLAICPPAHRNSKSEPRNPKQNRSANSEFSKRWSSRPEWRLRSAIVVGLLFGLCVLSRPTFWVFGGLMALGYLARLRFTTGVGAGSSWKFAGVTVAAVLLVTAAWPIRNLAVLGSPIMTTTHGGYTLLLGNNPAFYEEVVRQPWGTVWDGSKGPGQQVWVEGVHDAMRRDDVVGEVAQDRWMSARAWSNIGEQPGMFARACLLRFARFWNIVPSGPAAGALPRPVLWGLGGAYLLLFVAAAGGVAAVVHERRANWGPVLLLVVGFTAVHLVYWSNARMRAPVMPAVAVLAAAGVGQIRRSAT